MAKSFAFLSTRYAIGQTESSKRSHSTVVLKAPSIWPMISAAMAAAAAVAAPSAHAEIFGGATSVTARSCAEDAVTQFCPTELPADRVFTFVENGGPEIGSDASLSLPDGSTGFGEVTFDSPLNLPIIRASTYSGPETRINSNDAGYQEYTYTGDAPSVISFTSTLHIDDASTDGSTGGFPLGGSYDVFVSILSPSVIGTISTADDVLSEGIFSTGCGEDGVLAAGSTFGGTAGGTQDVSVSTDSCSSGPVVVTPGEQFVVAVGLQIPSDRGGFVDASHTFTTDLSPSLGAAVISNLDANLVSAESAVPEPSAWVSLLAGFGALGAVIRSRRKVMSETV